jgi:hypothetical protein
LIPKPPEAQAVVVERVQPAFLDKEPAEPARAAAMPRPRN